MSQAGFAFDKPHTLLAALVASAVRRLVIQGGSTALEQLTKKPGFFC